jgi:Flp pilus assembly protein TadD
VDKDPLLAGGHAVLGLALLAAGEAEDAERAASEALRLDPRDADAIRALGDVAARREHYGAAERRYLEAIAARPDDPELPSVLGGLHYRLSRYDDAAQ